MVARGGDLGHGDRRRRHGQRIVGAVDDADRHRHPPQQRGEGLPLGGTGADREPTRQAARAAATTQSRHGAGDRLGGGSSRDVERSRLGSSALLRRRGRGSFRDAILFLRAGVLIHCRGRGSRGEAEQSRHAGGRDQLQGGHGEGGDAQRPRRGLLNEVRRHQDQPADAFGVGGGVAQRERRGGRVSHDDGPRPHRSQQTPDPVLIGHRGGCRTAEPRQVGDENARLTQLGQNAAPRLGVDGKPVQQNVFGCRAVARHVGPRAHDVDDASRQRRGGGAEPVGHQAVGPAAQGGPGGRVRESRRRRDGVGRGGVVAVGGQEGQGLGVGARQAGRQAADQPDGHLPGRRADAEMLGQQANQVGQVRGGVVQQPVHAAGARVVVDDRRHEPGEMVHRDHGDEGVGRAGQGGEPAVPQVADHLGQADVLTRLSRGRLADHGGGVDHRQRDAPLGGEEPHRHVGLELGALVGALVAVEGVAFGVGQGISWTIGDGDPIARHVDQAAEPAALGGPVQHVHRAVHIDLSGLVASQAEAVEGGGVVDVADVHQPSRVGGGEAEIGRGELAAHHLQPPGVGAAASQPVVQLGGAGRPRLARTPRRISDHGGDTSVLPQQFPNGPPADESRRAEDHGVGGAGRVCHVAPISRPIYIIY